MVEAIFNRTITQKIKRTSLYKKIQHAVIDDLLKNINALENVGVMVNNVPHDCIVYVFRINELEITSLEIIKIIEKTQNKCALFVLLLYLRLSTDFKTNIKILKDFLKVYTKVKVVNEVNDAKYEYFDVIVDDLLEKRYFYGVYLKEYRF